MQRNIDAGQFMIAKPCCLLSSIMLPRVDPPSLEADKPVPVLMLEHANMYGDVLPNYCLSVECAAL